ncbi:MAG TPA: hypothetical protein VJB57_00475, partial [Dehalococcoidia bacterium]|nr:hypothetical protein [Dehalococcoidia bacterium]
MFSKLATRSGRIVMTGLVVATLGIGLLGAGAAHAQPKTIGNGTPCTYNGTSYPEGSVITDARGWKFMCLAGEWVEVYDAVTANVT